MDQDRLRRLDALFAERVLGHKPHEMPMRSIYDGSVLRELFLDSTDGLPRMLPLYTRSLDAAWEGLRHLAKMNGAAFDRVRCEYASEENCSFIMSAYVVRSMHPAEALVLACLRAVGCTEDEINAE